MHLCCQAKRFTIMTIYSPELKSCLDTISFKIRSWTQFMHQIWEVQRQLRLISISIDQIPSRIIPCRRGRGAITEIGRSREVLSL